MIFDTHAHYDDNAFDSDRDDLLSSLINQGVERVVNVASGMSSCITTMGLADKYDYIYAAVGVHPEELGNIKDSDMDLIEKYCNHQKVVAVGEIGLDYHYSDIDPVIQKEYFVKQLDIARKMNKPVIIHSRDAAADTLDILKDNKAEEIGGVIHCFSYSLEMARIYVDMGFFIGIGGVVTFKNSKKLKECVENLPLDRLVLETDCPYLAPEPNRGHRNDSSNLRYVVKTIADLKGLTEENVIEQTKQNAMRLYRFI